MDDLIRAARTRIKKKQEEMLSSADLIEQARIRNAYNGGAAKPDNYIKREKTVTPAGPYTPTIKPVQATATPIKPAPVPTATPIKPAPLPTVNRIKPVSPDSPLFNGYPFVRDYTRTAQNALNTFHEQNALTAAKKNLDAETSLYGAGLSYAIGDYDTADELATQAQKKAIEDKRTAQTKQGDALLQRIQSGEKIEAAQQTPDEFNKIMTGASYTQPVLINGTWIDMPAQYAQETNEKINADREKSKDTNRQAAQIKGASNAVKHDIDVTNYLSRPDFAEKSAAGASIQNPSYEDMLAAQEAREAGIPSNEAISNILNPAQFAKDNYEKIINNPISMFYDSFSNYLFLTDEEVQVYNYIYASEGRDRADEWLNSFKDEYNIRNARDMADTLNPYYLGFVSGMRQGTIAPTKWLSETAKPIDTVSAAAGFASESIDSKAGRMAFDLLNSLGYMTPSIVIGAATGGLINPKVGQIVGSTFAGLGAGGDAYEQALREGYLPEQARTYGVLTGASEAGAQYAIGGISALGGKVTGHFLNKMLSKVQGPIARVLMQLGIPGIGEGVEEVLQDIANPVFRNIALDENNAFKPFTEDALYSGLIGFLSSIILGAPGTVRSSAEISSLGKTINTDVMQQSLLDFGINQGVETEAFRQAEHIKKKLQEDKKVTPYEWGRLVMEASAELAKKHNVGSAEDANANQDANNNIYAAQETQTQHVPPIKPATYNKIKTANENANQNAGNNMYAAQETQAQGQTEVHTPEQLRIMKEYEEAVDPTIVEFIDRVQAGIASPKAKRTVGQINGNLAKEISNIVGFDVDGFSALLEPSAIKHINKRHGGIGQADQSLADKKDIARIGYVIENYDSVTKGKDDKPHWGHLDRYGNPAKIVEIRKRIDGEYVVFEAVPDTDAKAAYVVSARIEKADEKGQRMADAASSPAPYVRNAYADPNDSISNNSTNVNSQAGTARQVVNQIEQDVRAKQSQVDLRNRVSEEAAAQQFDALNERYGSIKAGENPKTDIAVPKRTSDSKKTRQFVRTILETGQLNNEMVADVKRAVIDEALSYVPISNQMLLTFAENEINRNPDTATSEWEGVAKKGGNLTAREIATGEILLKKAAQEGNAARLLSITQALSRQGTESGRATQAFRIIKNSGPLGMLYSIQQQVDAANRQNTKENGKLRNKKQGLIVLDEQLALDLANATTQEEITTAKDNLMQNVADQMPASWVEKWNQWRHMAMLANPKTHIRNFVGNAAFMPVVKTKEFLNAAIQAGLEKAGVLDRSQRTTTFKASEAAKEEAAADYPKIQKTLQSGGKYNPSNEINDKRTIFQNRVLEAVQKGNGRLLEAADGLFLKHYYTQALARYLTAQKVDLDNISPATLDRARAYAFDEALEATYRDYSAFAAKLQQWSNSSKVADFIISGVLPFKKTPINILKRGVEYSPAGLVDAVSRGTVQLKRGEITPAQYINRISKGLTGTGLAALGIWLSSLGIITGGASGEDDDRLNSVTGKQNYSINIGGRSYTLDWLAPDSIPFFVGVEFQRLCQGQYEDMTTEDILDTFSTMLEPMLNLSMLSSLNDTLNEISYSENKISAILQTIAYSYLLQAFPTLGSSIGRTIDGTQRRTYIDKNSGVPSAVQKFGQQIAGKIPGLTYTKQPYVNAWGQEIEERNIFTRIMQNFLSPGYLKTIDDSKVNQEVEAIYHETLDGDVIPKSPPKYFSVNGERKDLTGDEYTKFSKVTGQTAFNILNKMVDTEAYQGLDAAGKANAIVNAYDYALAKGKQAVSSYKPSGWIANADAQKVDPTEYIVARAAQDALVDDILMMNSENAHERVAQILDSGVDASDLRSRITSTVKPIYVEMYKSGSTDEVKQLRALLYNLNIGYDMGDFQQWTKGWWQ